MTSPPSKKNRHETAPREENHGERTTDHKIKRPGQTCREGQSESGSFPSLSGTYRNKIQPTQNVWVVAAQARPTSRLKKYCGLPVLGLVARQSLGWSACGGCPHNTGDSTCTRLLFLSSGLSRSTPRLVVGRGKCVLPLCHRTRAPSHVIAPSARSAGCGRSPTHGRCIPLRLWEPNSWALPTTCPRDALKGTPKEPPCNSTWWRDEEWRLRHFPSVVAGSAAD